jgi:hypothetical protein
VPWYHYDRLWHAVASKVPNETIRHSSYFNGDQKPYTPKS